MTSNTANGGKATFMSLPTELRLNIYECLFLNKKQTAHLPRCRPTTTYCGPPTALAILAVNHQVFSEAIPILYHDAEICIHMERLKCLPFPKVSTWLRRRVPEYARQYMKTIGLSVRPAFAHYHKMIAEWAKLPGITTIVLDVIVGRHINAAVEERMVRVPGIRTDGEICGYMQLRHRGPGFRGTA